MGELRTPPPHDLSEIVPHQPGTSRFQLVIGHHATIQLVALEVIRAAEKHGALVNARLLMGAFALHDIGEVDCAGGGDRLAFMKNAKTDHDELLAFLRTIEHLSPETRQYFRRHYLLQYAGTPGKFDKHDPELRAELEEPLRDHPLECQMFQAIEHLDYLLYTLYEWVTHGNARIMVHLLRRYHPRLLEDARVVPGFGNEFYTPGLVRILEELVSSFVTEVGAETPEEKIPNQGHFPHPSLHKATARPGTAEMAKNVV